MAENKASNYRSPGGRGTAIPATGIPVIDQDPRRVTGRPPRRHFTPGEGGSPSAGLTVTASQIMQRSGDTYYTDENFVDLYDEEDDMNDDINGIDDISEGLGSAVGHTVLDVAGLVPGVGAYADLANAVWYFKQKNYVFGLLSLFCAVPLVGDVFGTSLKIAIQTGGSAVKSSGTFRKFVKFLTTPSGRKALGEVKSLIARNPALKVYSSKVLSVIDDLPNILSSPTQMKLLRRKFSKTALKAKALKGAYNIVDDDDIEDGRDSGDRLDSWYDVYREYHDEDLRSESYKHDHLTFVITECAKMMNNVALNAGISKDSEEGKLIRERFIIESSLMRHRILESDNEEENLLLDADDELDTMDLMTDDDLFDNAVDNALKDECLGDFHIEEMSGAGAVAGFTAPIGGRQRRRYP